MAKTYTVDPARKPDVNIILHYLARFVFWVMGWKVVGHVPAAPKMLVTAGPHTANLDGFLMIMTSWIVRVKLSWITKVELTESTVGPIVKAAGGVGIDRKSGFNTVQQMVQKFEETDQLALAIAPEGTRRKLNHWKSGFYWMAVGANVPIYMGRLDYGRKVVDLSHPLVYPSGDIEKDIEIIFDAYRNLTPKHPEKYSDMRLRPSATKRQHEGATPSD